MALLQRQPRQLDPAFLAFIRTKPCVVCGAQAEAAHIRFSDAAHGSINPGVAARPDDSKVTPLCPDHHRNGNESQHNIGDERAFWQCHGLDPFEIAAALYAEFALIRKTPPPEPILIRKRTRKAKPKASRPIQGRSAWPAGRKIQSRPFNRG